MYSVIHHNIYVTCSFWPKVSLQCQLPNRNVFCYYQQRKWETHLHTDLKVRCQVEIDRIASWHIMNTIDWLPRFAETRTLNNLFLVFEHLPTATAEMCRFVWNSSNNDNISSLLVCKKTTKQQVKLGRHLQIWLHLTAGFSLLISSFLKKFSQGCDNSYLWKVVWSSKVPDQRISYLQNCRQQYIFSYWLIWLSQNRSMQ